MAVERERKYPRDTRVANIRAQVDPGVDRHAQIDTGVRGGEKAITQHRLQRTIKNTMVMRKIQRIGIEVDLD